MPDRNHISKIHINTALDYLQLAVWSLAYCLTYGLFVVFPERITLSQLIICQSIAPSVAAWLSGDLAREREHGLSSIVSFSPILLLLFLAWQRWTYEASSKQLWATTLIIFGVFIGLVVSQTCARWLAGRNPPLWIQPRLTMFNAIGLGLFTTLTGGVGSINLSRTLIGFAFAAAILIIITQATYLAGIRRTEPVLAALAISTSVPISLFADRFWYGKPLSFAEAAIGILYCCAVFFVQRMRTIHVSQ